MIHFPTDFELPICSVDPVTLTGLVLAGAGGALASSLAGGSGPSPTAPPTQAASQQTPAAKQQPQSQQPSFVGASAVPSNQSGQKTLLGQ